MKESTTAETLEASEAIVKACTLLDRTTHEIQQAMLDTQAMFHKLFMETVQVQKHLSDAKQYQNTIAQK